MASKTGSETIQAWPDASREAAQLVIDKYGEPHETTDTLLTWHRPGPWKRMQASRAFHEHRFPTAHTDSVESFLDYRVPIEKVNDITRFDGSVMVDRTAGEVSARCHDEEANFLALNLMHDIIIGAKTVEEARAYYGKEFLDYRRKQPTPYMEGLRFTSGGGASADPDTAILTDEDLAQAEKEGRESSG